MSIHLEEEHKEEFKEDLNEVHEELNNTGRSVLSN